MDEITNTQTPAVTTPAPQAGPSLEDLNRKQAELEHQREGLLRDLQDERRKRQELEQRLSAPAPSAAQPDVNADELGKVLNPYIAPVMKQVQEATQELEQLRLEKAQSYLVNKVGKNWDAIEADRALQDKLIQVARKYGISGNVYDRTVRAYELVELEDLRAKEAERARVNAAAASGGMPSGTPPAPVSAGKEYSLDDFNRMSVAEFDKLSADGGFRKVGDKMVYSKRS